MSWLRKIGSKLPESDQQALQQLVQEDPASKRRRVETIQDDEATRGSQSAFRAGHFQSPTGQPKLEFFCGQHHWLVCRCSVCLLGSRSPDTGAPPRAGRQNGARPSSVFGSRVGSWKGLTPAMVEREEARPSKSGSVWVGSQGARSDTGYGFLRWQRQTARLVSGYLEGLFSDANRNILQQLTGLVRTLQCPRVLAGDWNATTVATVPRGRGCVLRFEDRLRVEDCPKGKEWKGSDVAFWSRDTSTRPEIVVVVRENLTRV